MNTHIFQNKWAWIRTILLLFLASIAIFGLYFLGINLYEANFAPQSTGLTNVTYTDSDNQTLHGYLALPEGEGPHPAILLVHEWWGLSAGILHLADELAKEGYVVLAADAYRGQLTTRVPRALWLRLTIPTDQIYADLDTALQYLIHLPTVDSQRIAAMGFCFGGGQALQLGLRQPTQITTTVIYYGSLVTNPDLLRPLAGAAPVLGIFGAQDQQISPENVHEFENALNNLDIPNEIHIYEGVGHAFVNENNYNKPGPAMQAWQQTLAFLDKNLMNSE